MKQHTPLVSVLMPAYNAEHYIADTIKSVLDQTYTNFEFLIQDDGSTDRTFEIVNSFDDPRIKVLRNGSNLGLSLTRNLIFDRVTGDYIALVDADDVYEPNRIQVQVDFLEKHPDVSICGSYLLIMDESAQTQIRSYLYPMTHDQVKVSILFASPIGNPSAMIRTQVVSELGLRYNKDSAAEDMQFWSDALDLGVRFTNIPQKLVCYRVSSSQLTVVNRSNIANSAMDVSRSRMKLLGVELSVEDSAIFQKIFFEHNRVLDAHDVEVLKEIIIRLWRGNNVWRVHKKSVMLSHILMRYKRAHRRMSGKRLLSRWNQFTLFLRLITIQ